MDEKVVKKAKKGNKKAFDILIKEVQSDGYKLAYYYMKNRADSQDAVCNGIEKAYNKIGDLEKTNKFKTWFLQIVANEAKMLLRKKRKNNVVSMEEIQRQQNESGKKSIGSLSSNMSQYGSEKEGISREEIVDVRSALLNLEEEERSIVMLKYYQGYTFKEIAEITQQPESSVKTKNYAVLKRMKNMLEGKEITTYGKKEYK